LFHSLWAELLPQPLLKKWKLKDYSDADLWLLQKLITKTNAIQNNLQE
jgi:hypothetical protein